MKDTKFNGFFIGLSIFLLIGSFLLSYFLYDLGYMDGYSIGVIHGLKDNDCNKNLIVTKINFTWGDVKDKDLSNLNSCCYPKNCVQYNKNCNSNCLYAVNCGGD
jgi:hypothetical protein